MGLKEQFSKIKDNWLLIVLFVLGLFMVFFMIGGGGMRNYEASNMLAMDSAYSTGYSESYGGGYYPNTGNSLMPEVVNRIVIKTASMSTIVKDWGKSESDLKSYIKSNDAILTNENVNAAYGKYNNGYYTIDVPTDKYDALITQLKSIGDVQSFREQANDITGSYVRLQDIITAEKARLDSYEQLYASSNNVDDKIKLMDRIYNQKNTISGLEYQLANQDERIDYSQISFNMREKTPTHANVVFATFADLWLSFKSSLNVMLYMIAYMLPFLLLWLLIWGIMRLFKRN